MTESNKRLLKREIREYFELQDATLQKIMSDFAEAQYNGEYAKDYDIAEAVSNLKQRGIVKLIDGVYCYQLGRLYSHV